MEDLLQRGLGSLAQGLRERRFAAAAVVEACLARIARIDPTLNSFAALDAEGARLAARESDARFAAGAARSILEGIPVAIADDMLAKGLPATWGSRAFRDFVPLADELPVARLRAGGAIIVGKTNVPELGLAGNTANELSGVTRNPWDTSVTPGGAAGGSAASVAGGLVPAAVGVDGAGGVRLPAACTGLVGFKPSTGRIARIDAFPAILIDFESVGTFTRTVADTIALDVLAGPDPRDRRSFYGNVPGFAGPRQRILHMPRLGTLPVDPEAAAACERVARFLADDGHEVRTGEAFFDLEDLARIWFVIRRAGVAWMAQQGGRLAREGSPLVRQLAEEGAQLGASDYVGALERVAGFRRRCAELFNETDIVLTPAVAALPWPAEQSHPAEIDGRPAAPRDHAVFADWVNVGGLPAITLPVGVSGSGLPIGVQLVAGYGADPGLLDVASGLEMRWEAPPLPEL